MKGNSKSWPTISMQMQWGVLDDGDPCPLLFSVGQMIHEGHVTLASKIPRKDNIVSL